ncbi:MAG: sulfatase-like hydrolase/transferase, partial [Proteobacteria bacterium]|nr:sulfatase-like hydrolase/transferase [Pseudomonadota bacterium]
VMDSTCNGAGIKAWPDGGMIPFRGEKNTTWEGGFRVPMMIRWPAQIKANQISNEIISLEDWLPTLVAAAGEPNVKENHTVENNQNLISENGYLTQFGLQFLQSVFTESIKTNDFSQLKNQLQQNSDLKLLLGNEIIDNSNSQDSLDKNIWKFQNAQNKTMWLTFWEPKITLEAFYQGYYSESVSKLQNSLKDQGFYQIEIDGIVGSKTILAVAELQTSLSFNPSGFPDELTLYKLQKLNASNFAIETSGQHKEYYPMKENKPDRPVSRYALENSINY